MKDLMETRTPEVKENQQNMSLLLSKSRLPMKLLNIPRQKNIKLSTIAYTNSKMNHLKSRKLELRLYPLDYFTTKHMGQCG